jgi:hypothetical protein
MVKTLMNLKCNCVFADKTKKYSSGGTTLHDSNGQTALYFIVKNMPEIVIILQYIKTKTSFVFNFRPKKL